MFSNRRNCTSRKEERANKKVYRFLVVIEKADANYSAYSPDVPGCIATGRTREQAERNMHEALEMHVHGLLEDNLPVPKPHSFAEYFAVPSGGQ